EVEEPFDLTRHTNTESLFNALMCTVEGHHPVRLVRMSWLLQQRGSVLKRRADKEALTGSRRSSPFHFAGMRASTPTPMGVQMNLVIDTLEQERGKYSEINVFFDGFSEMGVFWDWPSLLQGDHDEAQEAKAAALREGKSEAHAREAADEAKRTAAEKAAFKHALHETMDLWYAHQATTVFLLTQHPRERGSTRECGYDQSGWTTYERCSAEQIKNVGRHGALWSAVADLGQGAGAPAAGRRWPVGPDEFDQLIEGKTFTNGADREAVKTLFRRMSRAQLGGVTKLDLRGLPPASPGQAAGLGACLRLCARLEELFLCGCKIGPAGCEALARALPSVRRLQRLCLSNNGIGGAGAEALARALPSAPCLEGLDLPNNGIGGAGAEALALALPSAPVELIWGDLAVVEWDFSVAAYSSLLRELRQVAPPEEGEGARFDQIERHVTSPSPWREKFADYCGISAGEAKQLLNRLVHPRGVGTHVLPCVLELRHQLAGAVSLIAAKSTRFQHIANMGQTKSAEHPESTAIALFLQDSENAALGQLLDFQSYHNIQPVCLCFDAVYFVSPPFLLAGDRLEQLTRAASGAMSAAGGVRIKFTGKRTPRAAAAAANEAVHAQCLAAGRNCIPWSFLALSKDFHSLDAVDNNDLQSLEPGGYILHARGGPGHATPLAIAANSQPVVLLPGAGGVPEPCVVDLAAQRCDAAWAFRGLATDGRDLRSGDGLLEMARADDEGEVAPPVADDEDEDGQGEGGDDEMKEGERAFWESLKRECREYLDLLKGDGALDTCACKKRAFRAFAERRKLVHHVETYHTEERGYTAGNTDVQLKIARAIFNQQRVCSILQPGAPPGDLLSSAAALIRDWCRPSEQLLTVLRRSSDLQLVTVWTESGAVMKLKCQTGDAWRMGAKASKVYYTAGFQDLIASIVLRRKFHLATVSQDLVALWAPDNKATLLFGRQ
ncbi:unnamed protein product, partial [Prorocentrum cordatum]